MHEEEAIASNGSRREKSVGRASARFPIRQFCQEVAILLESGISLHEALTAMHERERLARPAAVLAQLLANLRHGRGFGASLAACEGTFDPLFVATVEAGQRTGHTASILRRHAGYLAWVNQSRNKLISAAIYPAMLLAIGAMVMLFLVVFVIPRFADLYQDLGAELPWTTTLLMQVGTLISGEWPLLLLVVLASFAAVAAAWRNHALRSRIARMAWRVPRVGEALRLLQLARFYRATGMLLQAGVTVPAALRLVCDSVAGPMRPAASSVEGAVVQGHKLSDSLEAALFCDAVSLRMVRVGEHSGSLGEMMEKIADFHDEEIARLADWFGRVAGPLLMLLMGAGIGVVVVMMYMPIFDVAERIQ